jgi:hypothetical protein
MTGDDDVCRLISDVKR